MLEDVGSELAHELPVLVVHLERETTITNRELHRNSPANGPHLNLVRRRTLSDDELSGDLVHGDSADAFVERDLLRVRS